MDTPRYALIVGHGQPSDPDPAETMMAEFADRIAAHLPGWEVRGVTLAKAGALDAALEAAPQNPIVYPMFMSQGWFTQVQLVKRLGDHPARIALPFGLEPDLPALAAVLLQDVLADQGWQAGETRLFLPGHGSGRSPNAARDTYAFADALRALIQFADQRVAFVEQSPFLKEEAEGLGEKSISLPFFAAELGHVIDDIPEALAETEFDGIALAPLGCAPDVPALIAQSLLKKQAE